MARSSWSKIMALLILVAVNATAATTASAPAPHVSAAPPTPSPSVSASSPVTYVVGDALGWTVPAIVGASPKAYETWAANKLFKVGDKIVFNYVVGRHNVAQVNNASYTSCDTNTTALASYSSTSPTSITLSSPGEYFFMSTHPGHCENGQKLAINVVHLASLKTTSPSDYFMLPPLVLPGGVPLFLPPLYVPTAENSASSLGAAGISTILLSAIVALFLG